MLWRERDRSFRVQNSSNVWEVGMEIVNACEHDGL
jgi:hypothetical protein